MKRLLHLLLLAGCATTAVPERAPPALPQGFAVPQTGEAGPAVADRLAADPAWPRLVAAAEAGSPDLETAAARILQARAGVDAARAAGAPRIDAGVSVTQSRSSLAQFNLAPPGSIERDQTSLSPVIEAGWELDLFGRLKAGRAAAGARLDAATADAAATRLALEADLARNLVGIRTLDARRAAALEALAAARALDRLARVRVEAGLATGLDAATTAADVAAAEAALPPLAAARTARIAALSRLTARPPAEIASWLEPPAPLPTLWALPDVPSDLLQRRPDIDAAWARLRAADQDTAAALAARYPRLTLTGSLGWLADTVGALFTGDAFTASAGVLLAGPLIDFGRTAAEVEARRGAAAEAAGLYRGAVLRALAEVETELAAARAARAQAADLGRSAQSLATALRLAEAQYRGGLTDARAAAEAQRRLADARDRQLVAEGAALDSALALQLAVGGRLPPN